MSSGLIYANIISYWSFSEGFLCSTVCPSGPRIGVPYFSIELILLLVIIALIPLSAAVDFRPIIRFFGGVSALCVASVALANLLVPLAFLLNIGMPGKFLSLGNGPLPWFAPRLVLLVVASGAVVTLWGLSAPGPIRRPTRLSKQLGVSVVFAGAVFWPITNLAITSPTPFYLESGYFLALFYAIPAVIILGVAFLLIAPGTF